MSRQTNLFVKYKLLFPSCILLEPVTCNSNLIGVKICKMKRHILLVFNYSQNTIFKDF